MSKRYSGDMVDALAEVVRASIVDDMRAGVVGASVVDGFAMLHDWVDANEYILQALGDDGESALQWGDYMWSVVQRLEEGVDDLLRTRPLVQPLQINGREVLR